MDTPQYDHHIIEAGARELWEEHDIYRFDRDGTGPVFSVDTPPPYVSASHLHVGHAMSYSQPDFIVRYRRMRGERVFYPMGFDDNGLPTERYVEKSHGVKAAEMPRAEFVELCLAETSKTAARYEDVWRQVGLSVDWSLRYSTIDERCRRTSQASFIKLYEKGHLRRVEDPILWCPECRTALAQADVEDLARTGRMHRIAFALADSTAADGDSASANRKLIIATTRPELLPACVAMYFHPDDERYRDLLGSSARVPLFGHDVPIKASEAVDPAFGTGLMMVCTFGDSEDVVKWREDGLALRLAVTEDGRLSDLAGEFAGLQLTQARAAILARLADTGALVDSASIKQTVGVHERCLTPVEFQIRPQWFIGVREHREALRQRASELTWIPPFMARRLEDWIDGLKWDWNISRQRHYGVPFPVWFCADCKHPVLAELDALPVDPLRDQAPVEACPECGGQLLADPDVMDTWMTSSLTPQINDNWAAHADQVGAGLSELAPMSLRVQAFEIIRTWLFYSLVQSEFHFGRVPWTTVMISGWGLNEQGKKIAKRDLDQSATADGFNRYAPDHVIDRYGADALRLWATKARIGTDLRYNEKDVRTGRKFVIKLWNVSRFITMNLTDAETEAEAGTNSHIGADPIDQWMLAHLAETLDEVTEAFDRFDFTLAHQAASRFFWSVYCDRYLEMIKSRFANPDEHTAEERESTRAALRASFRAILGMFAPFTPFITEHLYQEHYRGEESQPSLHLTAWPTVDPGWRGDRSFGDQLATALDQVRVLRTRLQLGNYAPADTLIIHATTDDAHQAVKLLAEPLRAAARARRVEFGPATHESGVPGIAVALTV